MMITRGPRKTKQNIRLSQHACSTSDQYFHWFLLHLQGAPHVCNKLPRDSNSKQNNETILKQYKILHFLKNQTDKQFLVDFFSKLSNLLTYIHICMMHQNTKIYEQKTKNINRNLYNKALISDAKTTCIRDAQV